MNTELAQIQETLNKLKDPIPAYALEYASVVESAKDGLSNVDLFKFNAASFYTALLDFVPTGVNPPTVDQWLFYWNVYNDQRLIDTHRISHDKLSLELSELESSEDPDPSAVAQLDKRIRRIEERCHNIGRDLQKHLMTLSLADKPKHIDMTITKIKPSDVMALIRQNGLVEDAEFEVLDEVETDDSQQGEAE